MEQVRGNGKAKVVIIVQIWEVVVRCRDQTWLNANHLRDVSVRLDRVGHGSEHDCGAMRVANEVNLLARNARLELLQVLRVHDQFDHCRDVLLGNRGSLIVEVVSCMKIVIDRIPIFVRDRVPCAPIIANPDVIPSVKECGRQEGLGNVAASVVKPVVCVL